MGIGPVTATALLNRASQENVIGGVLSELERLLCGFLQLHLIGPQSGKRKPEIPTGIKS
jgi:hypothetical protein